MPDTVHIAGQQVNKKTLYIVAGVAGVFGIFYYIQHRNQAAAANTSNTSADSQNIDPQTGYPYGSPQDQQALAAAGTPYDSSSYVGGQVIGYDAYGNPVYGQQGGGTGVGVTGPGGFANNAKWAQAAEAQMGSTGTDSIAAALGKYLTGQPVTADMQTLIQEAIAIEGLPPVPGPSGFPPSINLQASGGGGGGGGGGSGGGTKPEYITVQFNGTLADIFKRRHYSKTQEAEIEKLNGLQPNDHVYKGQRLRIK